MIDQYIEAEILLADLLGYKWIPGTSKHRTGATWEEWEWIGPVGYVHPKTSSLTQPCRNNGDAFELMTEHKCELVYMADCILIATNCGPAAEGTNYDEHPDIMAASRFAIVKAVIAKLESK